MWSHETGPLPRNAMIAPSSPSQFLIGAAGAAVLSYAGYVATTWARYGRHADRPDSLLDHFLPVYEVGERHGVHVAAPAGLTMEAARALDFGQLPVAQALFRIRERLLGGAEPREKPPRGLVEETLAMGWGLLADEPGRALVMGSVCRPWDADPGFRAVPPEAFASFAEPGLVKILWAIGVEPKGEQASAIWTETRVATTDAAARVRFRRYWAALSPGILLIRQVMLRRVRSEAERRHRVTTPERQVVNGHTATSYAA